jgi:hypothetical protein
VFCLSVPQAALQQQDNNSIQQSMSDRSNGAPADSQDAAAASLREAGGSDEPQLRTLAGEGAAVSLPCIPETSSSASCDLGREGEEGRRGQRAYKQFVEAAGGQLREVRSTVMPVSTSTSSPEFTARMTSGPMDECCGGPNAQREICCLFGRLCSTQATEGVGEQHD